MRSRFLSGVTAGAIIGATASMLIAPKLDRGTRRKVRRTGRNMMHAAGDMYEGMKGILR
ncbi:YtxH domain-containing protein [Clostridium niameyense]|uniref:YtxH domain-containing protein n=1 Tax=Clostridium niameyense TaxID=1622073 RepID=A0A6M0RBN9_9CLOT|nr:YtxH domain-containing protein [Clostridium niameyense]NEZ47207.1 YtxH domain-containing protein [Clostridium niameyense]